MPITHKSILFIIIICLIGSTTNAVYGVEYSITNTQNLKRITGIVVDENNQPVVGANIVEKTTNNIGTITDIEGQFSLNVPNNAILSISSVGYVSQEIMIGDEFEYRIVLKEDVRLLEEFVVIGYGSVSKQDLTGAVGQVEVPEIIKAPVPSFEQALAGRVSGVLVTSDDDQPGSGMNIIIRGAGSISQSTAPLYVIDGTPIEDFDASGLNMTDIETINILKDASATAIYGARGANGVVVIETKKGKEGLPSISYSGSYGVNSVTKTMNIMSAYEFVKYQLELNPQYATSAYFPDITAPNMATLDDLEYYRNVKGIDWQNRLFRTGDVHIHSISLRGGTPQTRYFVSGSYFDQQGTVSNSGYKRYQGRLNLHQNISKKLRLNMGVNFNKITSFGRIASEGEGTNTLLYAAWGYRPISGRLTQEDLDLENELIDPEIDYRGDVRVNPVISAENTLRRRTNTGLLSSNYLIYDISKYLSLKVQGSINNSLVENEFFYNSLTSQGTPLRPGNAKGVHGGVSWLQNTTFSNENTLTYNRVLKRIHRLNMVGGMGVQKNTIKSYGMSAQNLPNEELGLSGLKQGTPSTVSSMEYDITLASFFGRAIYNLKQRYLFTFTFRADGSSKFPKNNRWGYFPSGAFAWQMNNEPFMKKVPFINESKLRVSHGLTGNNRIGAFDYLPLLDVVLNNGYSFGNGPVLEGAIPVKLGNKNLKWETTTQLDLGYDLGLFNDRIKLTIDLYQKKVSNLLLRSNMSWISGHDYAFKNIGKLRNQGLEITLSTLNIDKEFKWRTDFNIAFNDNKVLRLAENEEFLLSNVVWHPRFNTAFPYIAAIGQSASQFFGVIWDGIYQMDDFIITPEGDYILKSHIPDNGSTRSEIRPGDIKYKDINGDGTVDSKDATVIGRALPIHIGGLTNIFSYKGFELSVFLQWSYGNDILNANKSYFMGNQSQRPNLNQFAEYSQRWTPENQSNTMFRAGGGGPDGVYSSWLIEDGSYIRLKTISLSYEIPTKIIRKLKLKSASVSASGQNLYTLTKYSGMDPEVSVRNSILTPGFDFSAYPRSRAFVFGLNITL